MYFVFDALAAILLARYHTVILRSSLFVKSKSSFRLEPDFSAEVSSANRNVLRVVQLGKSLMNTKNRVGPNRLPCITDISTGFGCEKLLLMSTICDLLER
jgi:hypothetical protein